MIVLFVCDLFVSFCCANCVWLSPVVCVCCAVFVALFICVCCFCLDVCCIVNVLFVFVVFV